MGFQGLYVRSITFNIFLVIYIKYIILSNILAIHKFNMNVLDLYNVLAMSSH
jgi:hypothetical protein